MIDDSAQMSQNNKLKENGSGKPDVIVLIMCIRFIQWRKNNRAPRNAWVTFTAAVRNVQNQTKSKSMNM